MKKSILIILFVFVAGFASAQIKFEPGYFITNEGQRVACEIKNMDWRYNPDSFEYREPGGETKKETVGNIAEFGIDGEVTYRKHQVDIDRSTDLVNRMGNDRNPQFASETLFLRLLVDGKAALYQYESINLLRFFFSVDQAPVKQLVYKRYIVNSPEDEAKAIFSGIRDMKMAVNEQYKQQIFNEMKCASIEQRDAERLKYKRDYLMRVFRKYNDCQGSSVATNEEATKKGATHITLRPGLTYNSLQIRGSQTLNFENKASYRIGMEVENVLPHSKGRWALVLEPAYQTYSATSGAASIKYSSFDLGAGFRRYLHVRDQNKLYATFEVVYGIVINGENALQFPGGSLKVNSGVNVSLAVGYMMKRFSAELNYGLSRGIMGGYVDFSSSYGGPALIVGYRFSK